MKIKDVSKGFPICDVHYRIGTNIVLLYRELKMLPATHDAHVHYMPIWRRKNTEDV